MNNIDMASVLGLMLAEISGLHAQLLTQEVMIKRIYHKTHGFTEERSEEYQALKAQADRMAAEKLERILLRLGLTLHEQPEVSDGEPER